MTPRTNETTSAPQLGLVHKPELHLVHGNNSAQVSSAIATWSDRAIFLCLCVLAFAAPQYIKLTTFAFVAALLVWTAKLLICGRKYESQSLILPALIFLAAAGIASALSYVPVLSWERMRSFVLLPLAFVITQNLKSIRQIRILVTIVLVSATLSAARTGWQYAFGIGIRLVDVPANSLLYQDGVRSGDLVQLINGRQTRSLGQWKKVLGRMSAETKLRLHVARQAPVYPLITYFNLTIDRKHLEEWLNTPGNGVARGRPLRAQGHLDHFIRYAGVMMQLALLAFGLLLACRSANRWLRMLLGLVFAAITAALFATVTRTYIIGLLLGCALQFWLLHQRFRKLVIAGLTVGLVVAVLWVNKERGQVWFSAGDQFRFEIWKDSLQLIPHHPLFGVGLDSVNQYGDQWNVAAFKEFAFRAHFHSSYVQLAVDCGLPCLAAWVWLLTSYVLLLWRSWRHSQHWQEFPRGTLLGILASAVIFVVASGVNYTLADAEVISVTWLCMGLAIALIRMENTIPRHERPRLTVVA
jgi:hypothetical protein